MIGLLVIVALVIDMGATRSLRRDARTAADAGATAGVVAMGTPGGSACSDAMAYTFQDLGGMRPPSSLISTACAQLASACVATTARTANLTFGGATVQVTNPVPDPPDLVGVRLMSGTSLGSAVSQPVTTSDGAPCDRVGVEVTRDQPAFFRGVLGGNPGTYTVHSVARFDPRLRNPTIPPALVALNQHTCAAIDAGNNGNIVLIGNTLGPGIAASDSDGNPPTGPRCSGATAILASSSHAQLFAESMGSAMPGQLVWYSAPPSVGFNTDHASTYQFAPALYPSMQNVNYVGQLSAGSQRITRVPADKRYHCTNVPTSVQPMCTTPDRISALQTWSNNSKTSPPPNGGFTTYTGPCDTSGGTPPFPSGNVWVNCPTFTVKGFPLSIPGGGTVIFNGSLSVEAGGTLLSNTSGATDANGYPIPSDSSKQTTLIINDVALPAESDCSMSNEPCAFDVSTNSSAIYLAQTTVFSQGGFRLQSAKEFRWTPPAAGDLKSLMYWSESPQVFSIQGGPQIYAKGVVFQGNGQAIGGGGGTIDLTNVQLWVDTIATNGSTTVILKADPENSIPAFGGASKLIR
jgi:hypothetical protein